MRLLLQRVTRACVRVHDEPIAQIGAGLLIFVGVFPDDGPEQIRWLADKVVGLRIFADADKPMNADIRQVGGELLVVSQFTLAADTSRGNRPGFSTAAEPYVARERFAEFVAALRERFDRVATGEFGADMQIELVNDGPATFVLDR
ncbi:MAG: D-aminoacyl-tRNA deacylase [Proteobacteria bacterium]|nr:D-aminoacyl-tRNA deacylase [Pseudomonadota bacterium]